MVRHPLAWLVPILLALFCTFVGQAVFAGGEVPAPNQARVLRNANLRAGPGTGYAIVGYAAPGDVFAVFGCNSDCTWYQLAPDCWIAAFLVTPVQTVAVTPATAAGGGVTGTTALTDALAAGDAVVAANAVENPTRCPQTARPAATYAGPGTFYGVVDTRRQGECVAVVGRNQDGTWYQLSHGMWIAAADVQYAEPATFMPLTDLTPTPTPTSTPIPTNTPDAAAQVATPTPSRSVVIGSGASGQGCDPNYVGACVPANAGDVNCGSLPKSFLSVGDDPYGLDGDKDGIACE